MGEKAVKQFKTRFSKGIEIRYAENAAGSGEQEYRSRCLSNAVRDVFSELLGRTPSEEELSGNLDITASKGRFLRRKNLR